MEAPAPWRPAERLRPERAVLLNRLLHRRRPLPLRGLGLAVTTRAPPARMDEPERLPLRLGGEPALLEAPRALADVVLAALDPAAPSAVGEARLLLLELALEGALDALDAALPAAPSDGLPDGEEVALGVHCEAGVAAWTARLRLDAGAARRLAAALERLPPSPLPPAGLRVPVHLRLGCCTLDVAELRALRPGDVLLPERGDGTTVVAVAGERSVWHAYRDGAAAVVDSPRRAAAEAGTEEWTMGDWVLPDAAGPQDAGLDELPVRLVFEAGRVELTLGELGAVGPGHVFALPGGPPGRVDILANGRRIGQGELVQLGEGTGVRLLGLAGRPSDRG